MKQAVTWIVLADGRRALVLQRRAGAGLEPVPGGELHGDVHRRSREIDSDRPGRSGDSTGPHRHAMEPRSDPHQHEESVFVKSVADWLDERLRAGAFERLIVVAPPRALGDMRQAYSPAIRAAIQAELAKDLLGTPIPDIELHLRDTMFIEPREPRSPR
jgi:protein required for attachment to host cells